MVNDTLIYTATSKATGFSNCGFAYRNINIDFVLYLNDQSLILLLILKRTKFSPGFPSQTCLESDAYPGTCRYPRYWQTPHHSHKQRRYITALKLSCEIILSTWSLSCHNDVRRACCTMIVECSMWAACPVLSPTRYVRAPFLTAKCHDYVRSGCRPYSRISPDDKSTDITWSPPSDHQTHQ